MGIVQALIGERLRDRRGHEPVADVESRQSVDLGKGAKNDHVRTVAHEIREGPLGEAICELQIGLIDDDQRATRDRTGKVLS